MIQNNDFEVSSTYADESDDQPFPGKCRTLIGTAFYAVKMQFTVNFFFLSLQTINLN